MRKEPRWFQPKDNTNLRNAQQIPFITLMPNTRPYKKFDIPQIEKQLPPPRKFAPKLLEC